MTESFDRLFEAIEKARPRLAAEPESRAAGFAPKGLQQSRIESPVRWTHATSRRSTFPRWISAWGEYRLPPGSPP